MTMTEYSLCRELTLTGWFHDARRLFAANPPTLSVIGSRSAAAPVRAATEPAKYIAVARSRMSRPGAIADSVCAQPRVGIAAADWDLLFRAALERLACVAAEKPAPQGTGLRLQAPGTALRECLVALDQLRKSAPAVDA